LAKKTVRFFRAVDTHGRPPAKRIPWNDWLQDIDGLDNDSARVKAGKDDELLGVPWYGGDLPDLLLVCKVRRGSSMPLLEVNRKFRRIRAAAGEGIAEASHVALYPGNVVAVMRDGYSPSHVRVAEYLNGVLGLDPELKLEPAYRRNVRRKLAEVDVVQLVHLKFTSDQVRALAQRVPRLHRMIGRMNQDYGQLIATLDLRVPGRHGYDEESAKLLEDVRALVRQDGDDGVSADAGSAKRVADDVLADQEHGTHDWSHRTIEARTMPPR
jgi:hypothetical protein